VGPLGESVDRADEPDPGRAAAPSHSALLLALRRLDALLEPMLQAALARGGVAEAALRGLFVSPEEAAQLIHRDPCVPPGPASGDAMTLPKPSPLDRLAEWFSLSPFELDVVLIALAPELDLRYERIYGFLQDDASRRRATVDLALNLRTASAQDKIERLRHFLPGAPLIRHGVVRLTPDPGHADAPLLAHTLKLDAQVLAMLLGHASPDARMAPFCRLVAPRLTFDHLALVPETSRALAGAARRARHSGVGARLWFHGHDAALKSGAAQAFAGALGQALLHVDTGRMAVTGEAFGALLPFVFREASRTGAVLYIEKTDDLRERAGGADYDELMRVAAAHGGCIVFDGRQPWISCAGGLDDVIDVPFGVPGYALRKRLWRDALAASALTLDTDALDALSIAFRLCGSEIERAVRLARVKANWRAASSDLAYGMPAQHEALPCALDYYAAARVQCGHGLEALARKIQPKQAWYSIALPEDTIAQLREICDHARAPEGFRRLGLRAHAFLRQGPQRTLYRLAWHRQDDGGRSNRGGTPAGRVPHRPVARGE
jgi:hypothetical protein